MADHPLTAGQLDNLYDATDVITLLRSVSELWLQTDPAHPSAQKAISRFNSEGLKAEAAFYKQFADKYPDHPEWIKKYVGSYYRLYQQTRTVLYSPDMADWLKSCEQLMLLKSEGQGEIYKLKADFFYQERDIGESVKTLEQGLRWLDEREKTVSGTPFVMEKIHAEKLYFFSTIILRLMEAGDLNGALSVLQRMQRVDSKDTALSRIAAQLEARIASQS